MASSVIKSDFYKSGDIIDFSNTSSLSGIVTNGAKTIVITYFTPKRIDNISSVLVNSCVGGLRGVQGMIDNTTNNSNLKDLYTVTSRVRKPNIIELNVEKSTAFSNVINNTPISFYGAFNVTLN